MLNIGKNGKLTMDIKDEIEEWFPKIIGKPYKIISVYNIHNNSFNCVSYTLGIYNYWMWTNEDNWISSIPRNLKVESFKLLYEYFGFEECDNIYLERGFTKIVFYAKNGYPTHAALQSDNMWRSKCGYYIIEHDIDWISGNGEDEYGDVVFIMKKKIDIIKENKFYHYEDVPVSLFWNFIRLSERLDKKFEFNTSLINSKENSLNQTDYIFYVDTDKIEKDDLVFEFMNSIVLSKFVKYLTENDEDKFGKLFFGISKNNKLRFGYYIGDRRYVLGNIDYKSIDMKRLEKNIKYISNDISISTISKKFKSSLTILNNLKDILKTYLQHYSDVKILVDVEDNILCIKVICDDEDILNSVYLDNILKSNKVYRLNVEFNLEEKESGNNTIYQITIK